MPRSFDKHDREYLAELMQYFPVTLPLSLDAAEEQIKDSCNNQPSAEEFAEALKAQPEKAAYSFFQKIPSELHKQFFAGILNNAGVYRKPTDPNKGEVFFGPSTNRFAGADPPMIDSMLRKNISSLTLSPTDPVYIAARFYQRFVYIHPFNDGNGRISRFIVEVYLIYHQYRIDFEQLNYCHRKLKLNHNLCTYHLNPKFWSYGYE